MTHAGFYKSGSISLLVFACLFLGCEQPAPFKVAERKPRTDREAPFDPPKTYPGWAYDAPLYVQPESELKAEAKVRDKDPEHFFTKKTVVMIRKPDGYTPEETPRVAIWWTNNRGFHWQKAGYLGRGQSHFPFEVSEDGDYGIRFVGPGQEAAMHSLPLPERVYHVDTLAPKVEVAVDPVKTWYTPGQEIVIRWRASDYHLIENPVRLGLLPDFASRQDNSIELQRDLPNEGTFAFVVPADVLGSGIQLRADALDRAGNLGVGYSHVLQIVEPESLPDRETPPAVSPEESPAEPEDDSHVNDGEHEPAAPIVQQHLAAESEEADSDGAMTTSATAGSPMGRASELAQRVLEELAEMQAAMHRSWTSKPSGADCDSVDAVAARYDMAEEIETGEDIAEASIEEPCPPEELDVVEVVTGFNGPEATDPCESETPSPSPSALPEVYDPTFGNGVWTPLPATCAEEKSSSGERLAHPWRVLGVKSEVQLSSVWTLPRPLLSHDLMRIFQEHLLIRPESRGTEEQTPTESPAASEPVETPADLTATDSAGEPVADSTDVQSDEPASIVGEPERAEDAPVWTNRVKPLHP